MATQKEKLAQLAGLLGDNDVLQGFLNTVKQKDQEAEAMGISHKEENAPTIGNLMEVGYSIKELIEIGNAYKEAQAEMEEDHLVLWDDEPEAETVKMEDDKPSMANRPLTRDEFNAGINRLAALISGKGATTEKDTAEIDAINGRIAQLEANKEALQLQLDDLNGLQPRAMSGYRASQQATPTETPHGEDEATKELRDMAQGMHGGAAQMIGLAKGFADTFGQNGTF